MYSNAYKCNTCGFVTKQPGIHCNTALVPVVVLENNWENNSPVIIREVVREVVKDKESKDPYEVDWHKMK